MIAVWYLPLTKLEGSVFDQSCTLSVVLIRRLRPGTRRNLVSLIHAGVAPLFENVTFAIPLAKYHSLF